MKPYFSIIIPTYNRCELVKKCITSLQLQSFSNWECIIINDGSTDNTESEIVKYISNDERIKLITQPNSERAISRNNGAKIAKGEFYIFLDSDDYFEQSHLENLHQKLKLQQEKVAMFFTNGKCLINGQEKLLENNEIPSNLPIDFFLQNSVVPARVCLHADILTTFSFDPRTIIVEDTVLWTEILDKYPVIYIPIDSVIYNWHGENSVNIEKFNAYLQRLAGLKVLFYKKEVSKRIPTIIKRKHLNRCYYGISEYHLFQKEKIKAISWMLKSLIYYPELDIKFKLARLLFLLSFVKKTSQG